MKYTLELHEFKTKKQCNEFIGTLAAIAGGAAILGTIALYKTAKAVLSPVTHAITGVKKVWNATDPDRYKEDEKIRKMMLKQAKSFREMCEAIILEAEAEIPVNKLEFNVSIGELDNDNFNKEAEVKVVGNSIPEFLDNLEKAVEVHGKLSDKAESEIKKELNQLVS